MTTKEIFDKIYDMQAELNKVIGRDTLNCSDEDKRREWIIDYLWALHDEATELSNCFRWKWWDTKVKEDESRRFELFDEKNAKIELIDIIHFFISLVHLVIENDEECKDIVCTLLFNPRIEREPTNREKFNVVKELIANCLSLLVEIEAEKKSVNLLVIPTFTFASIIGVIARFLNMTPQDIFDVYQKKCKINFERQNQNYSMDTKTEEDNVKLAESI